MKIIHVCPRFLPYIGGVETHVYEIARRLSKKHEVLVYTTDPSGKLPKVEIIDNIKVRRFYSFAPSESYFFSPGLYSALKKESCDAIHIHLYHALPALEAVLANSNGAKIIFNPYFHGRGHTIFRNLLFKVYHLVGKKIFQNSDVVICSSEYEKKMLEYFFKIKKISIIPLGIDFTKFKQNPRKNNKIKTILYVGRLEGYKGINHLIKAVNKLRNHYDIKLKIIGDGPYRTNLENLVKKMNLNDNVILLGKRSLEEVAEEYKKADVLVLPSSNESFGLVLIEALKAGLTVLSTPVGEAPFLIKNKMVLKLEMPANYGDIADKLTLVFENEFKLPKRKYVNRILNRYSYDSITKKVEEVYSR